MADKSAIEWTDATWIDPQGRIRTYRRKNPGRPGQQLRRAMAKIGLRWCRTCRKWREDVTNNGLCREHERAAYRAMYADNRERIASEKIARRRGIRPVPRFAAEYLLEQFEGLCAYCRAATSTTWDHIVPIIAGGLTVPGNIVPACGSCNSSKRDSEVVEWARKRGFILDLVGDVTTLVAA